MKKRMIGVFLATLTVCVLFAGCKKNVGTPEDNAVQTPETTEEEEGQEKEDEEGVTGEVVDRDIFGYSCHNSDNPYFDILQQSIELALDEIEYGLLSKDPKGDAELQIQQIQDMIKAGVSAVIVSPVDWESITPALEALEDAGIPVISVDTPMKDQNLIDAYIGMDHKQSGLLCGKDLVRQRPNGGKVVILECSSMNAINERITGFEEAISKAVAGFEVLVRSDVQGKKEIAKTEMEKILKENAQIDAVMCGDDQIALGAIEAIKEAKRENILVYGVGGTPSAKKEVANKDSALAGTAALSPIVIGRKAVETAFTILKEEEYEKEIRIEPFLINKKSVEMYGTDGWQ